MARGLPSRFRTRPPLETQFQRGVVGGFVFTAVVAVSVLVLTELTSDRVADQAGASVLIADQRVDLIQLRADAGALALSAGPEAAADLRVSLADRSARITDRHVDITIARPDFSATEVDIAGESMLIGDAVRETVLWVDTLADFHATSPGATAIMNGYLTRTIHLIEGVDAELVRALDTDATALGSTAETLRDAGRIIALIALVGAAVRLLIVGQGLVRRLGRDQQQAVEAEKLHRLDRARRELDARLAEGLESAEEETDVRVVVERAFSAVIGEQPAEMLLADSSKAHLRATAANPAFDAPGCGVTSPWSCPAVRRGSTIVYDDSSGIRACPYLTGRESGECSAVCVPVAFMGDAMGVLHVTGDVGWTPETMQVESLEIIASQAAMRLGQIRSMAQARLQASTDVLTGLPNRRATEEHIGQLMTLGVRGSVAVADLDRFKQLNDTYGHEAGDRALRMFAEVVRSSIREDDWAGRWGGEEFVIYLPELNAREAKDVLDRVRGELALRCTMSDGPDVTVSIGVVDTTAGNSLDGLVALADDCLYFAKENGRDQVVVGPVSSTVSSGAGGAGNGVAS